MSWQNHCVVLIDGGDDTRKGKIGGYGVTTLGEIFDRKHPTALAKLVGDAIIPSSYAEADARVHAVQRECGSFVALIYDVDDGNHALEDINDLIAEFFGEEIASLVYSTASATADNRKWRFVIPLAEPTTFAERDPLMRASYAFFESRGVRLDRTLLRAGQIMYLQNVPPERRIGGLVTGAPLFYDSDYVLGIGASAASGLAPEWIAQHKVAQEAAEKAAEAAKAEAAVRLAGRPCGDSIARYNASNRLSDVLLSWGYEPSPHREGDWRSPHQRSPDSWATRVFEREDGTEYFVSMSESDAKAGIGAASANGARYGDPFDLLVHYRFGGNFAAALNSLTEDLPPQLAEAVALLTPTDDFPDPVMQEKAIRSAYAGFNSGDLANGEALAALFRDRLLHVPETGHVLKFDPDAGWLATNAEKTRLEAAKFVIQKIAADASRVRDDDDLRKKLLNRAIRAGNSLPRMMAMTTVGFGEPGLWASAADFDADPTLLGVRNGVLRLDTGEMMKPAPGLLISKRANVTFDPSAGCPQFDAFLGQVQPEVGVRRLLQQLAGIMFWGGPLVQKLVFMHGYGANGKSTFMETMAFLLGDYAAAIPTELLMQGQRSSQGASPDLMMLKGARLAFCNETGEGRRLDGPMVKQLTGGDTITARAPYGPFISFQPSHLLVMTGNHKPFIDEDGISLWRRMLLIDWPVTIPDYQRDAELPDRLRSEAPGVLNWALAGLKDFFQTRRPSIPDSVAEATAAYRSEQDLLGCWIEERMVREPAARCETVHVYHDYQNWCTESGLRPMSKNSLSRRLEERGVKRGGDGRAFYLGIRLARQA
jgi:P4 family phage/plasmid primase-like protien